MKLLINDSYHSFGFGVGAKEYLLAHGYSEADADAICNGDCPRDMPILFELLEKFGCEDGANLIVEEVADEPYIIDNYDDMESVTLASDLRFPGDTFHKREESDTFEKIANEFAHAYLGDDADVLFVDDGNGAEIRRKYRDSVWAFLTLYRSGDVYLTTQCGDFAGMKKIYRAILRIEALNRRENWKG